MSDEDNQLLAGNLLKQLYDICNYEQIVSDHARNSGTQDLKINHIDVVYLLRNQQVKEMLQFFNSKVKSSQDLLAIRQKIKMFSLHKEKIEKLDELGKKRNDLVERVKEKKTTEIKAKDRLKELRKANSSLKVTLEEKRKRLEVLKSKQSLVKFSKVHSESMKSELGQMFEKLESFKTGNSLMTGEDNLVEFLQHNAETIEKKLDKENISKLTKLPFYYEELLKEPIMSQNISVFSTFSAKILEEVNLKLKQLREKYEVKQTSEATLNLTESLNESFPTGKFETLAKNYSKVIEELNGLISSKQKKLIEQFKDRVKMKEKLEELKRINTELVSKYQAVFVPAVMNNIKSIVNDSLTKEMIYLTKVEKEKVSILQKGLVKTASVTDTLPKFNTGDIKTSFEISASILKLLMKYKQKIDRFISKNITPLSVELDERYQEFQNSFRNEYHLFNSMTSQSKTRRISGQLYSFKSFGYSKALTEKLGIFSKKDILNKFFRMLVLLKRAEVQQHNSKRNDSLFNNEVFRHFLLKNEKVNDCLMFFDKELPTKINSFVQPLIKSHLTSSEILNSIKDFEEELKSIQELDHFIETMPDGLRQILVHWKKF